MKINKASIFTFVAPVMILISTIGLIFKENHKKIFYLPLGLMGICMILEKDVSRNLDRRNLLKKIKSFKKIK